MRSRPEVEDGPRVRTARAVVNGSPLWPPVTGVQRVARGFADRLLIEGGGDVAIAGGPPGGDRSGGPAVRRSWRVLREQAWLPVEARHAEVILNLGNLAPLSSRKNLVVTYDLHALHLPHHYRRGWAAAYWKLSAGAYRRARYRVTLTRVIADELESTLGGRVDAVVPPGVDDAFRPAPPAMVAALTSRLGLHDPYLVVVGWSQPAKRARLALEAHAALAADVPHQLAVVGARQTDFARVELGAPSADVVMAGRLPDRELAALYSGAAGLLFPTGYEGFGLPPVEALACGAPVAASAIPVLREVLGELPGVRFVDEATPEAWAAAAGTLLSEDRGHREARSRAALDRYPWEGKGRALLELVHR
jgi:glycosyltransferase involved in cell wall biosynthesis